MRTLIPGLALCILVSSCGNSETEPVDTKPTEKSYFPVAEYIKGELNQIDSLPVGIMKKIIKPHHTDSSFIERSEFRALANQFTGSELEKSSLESNYNEHSFMDQTTGYYTFTYQPKNNEAPYRRVDVLVKPGATSDKVRSIYLEKSSLENDTLINERLFWKANTSFSIIKEKTFNNQNPVIEQLIVIWEPNAY